LIVEQDESGLDHALVGPNLDLSKHGCERDWWEDRVVADLLHVVMPVERARRGRGLGLRSGHSGKNRGSWRL